MTPPSGRHKTVLLLDDDQDFLSATQEILMELSAGRWEILTAQNHAQALELLTRKHVDILVLDVNMPLMDGVQFLQLVQRTHPGLHTVMLTSMTDQATRERCLSAGAALFLEKLIVPDGFSKIFSAIDELPLSHAQSGFQGVMRRVGLQEVLQLECLGRKSSILEIFTGRARGRIYISDGAILHAEAGALQGEMALYSLLALRGGGFNLLPYEEPPQRTIAGHWEFLLMEGARLADEGSVASVEEDKLGESSPAIESWGEQKPDTEAGSNERVEIAEMLLCSGAGEILHVWNCEWVEHRRELLRGIEQHSRELMAVAPIGDFEQLELLAGCERVICQAGMDRHLFVRALRPKPKPVEAEVKPV